MLNQVLQAIFNAGTLRAVRRRALQKKQGCATHSPAMYVTQTSDPAITIDELKLLLLFSPVVAFHSPGFAALAPR